MPGVFDPAEGKRSTALAGMHRRPNATVMMKRTTEVNACVSGGHMGILTRRLRAPAALSDAEHLSVHPATSPIGLTQQAEARWRQIRAARPDLAPAIDLQRSLVTRIIELGDALSQADWPRFAKLPSETAAKLERGVPLLRHESIPFPSALLAEALRESCQYLARGGAGNAAEHIGQALRARVDSMPSLSSGHRWRGIRGASGQGPRTWDWHPISCGWSPSWRWVLSRTCSSTRTSLPNRSTSPFGWP